VLRECNEIVIWISQALRMKIFFLTMGLAACSAEYTRCEARFADDPNGLSWDGRVMEPIGSENLKEAKCAASLKLCDRVESRAMMQGISDLKHEPLCTIKPVPYECSPFWMTKFQFLCEIQEVSLTLPWR
jgi:hypothetical protein